ncbi:MAG TPA: phosphoenolpyruvate synthase, partial [Desulfosalsimonadaceae bacterium]|nr:phosphoenolpyruvate synthase [Desulfosalsimonadaceae bacterium]
LMGPGRWGTQSPEMGIPVKFSEINNIAVIAEISHQMSNMVPDLSFGTHFFHDLIETGIFYMAIYPENAGVVFKADWLQSLPNRLESFIPAARHLRDVVTIADTSGYGLMLASDIAAGQVACYLTHPADGGS